MRSYKTLRGVKRKIHLLFDVTICWFVQRSRRCEWTSGSINPRAAWKIRWRHNDNSKRQYLYTFQHGVTFLKIWFFSNKSVKNDCSLGCVYCQLMCQIICLPFVSLFFFLTRNLRDSERKPSYISYVHVFSHFEFSVRNLPSDVTPCNASLTTVSNNIWRTSEIARRKRHKCQLL